MADSPRQTGFPGHWAADVVLRDGGTAHLRPITVEDADALQAFHLGQSAESTYMRFFAPMPRISDRDLERFTHVDHHDRVALVAEVGDRLIAVGRYERLSPDEAEVAFNVADSQQGRGLGSVLLEHLAAAARERRIRRFVAEVLPQNRKMVQVFRDAGYEVTHAYDDGVISLHFDIDPTERSRAVMAAREHRAEAASLQALMTPRSVAVVGASGVVPSVGAALLDNLLGGGFTGSVHPVNPGADVLGGLPVHASVADIDGPVDLAVVAVPAQAVRQVVADCAAAGVKGLVVVSSGFAETGAEGLALQRELVRTARAQGMRVVGPNSFGMVNTDPEVRLNASLAPDLPQPGGLGLFSQSGALGVAVLASAARRGLGVSSFVSAGNRADVSGNDLMQFWEEDPRTTAVGLYLESVGNPRKFSRVARRLARRKPVVVVKSGVSGFGVPPGHEVRQSRAPREAFGAMLRQAGVIRTENIHQLFDVAQLLVHQPLPAGERVAVVANSEALAALAAEAASSWGLDVAPPVTVAPQASAEDFRSALRQVFADPSVDSVVASFIPPLGAFGQDVVTALAEASAGSEKTAAACFVGLREVTHEGMHGSETVPAFPTPEDAARALAAVTRYAQWRARDPGVPVEPTGCNPATARELVDRELAGRDGARADHPSGLALGEDRVAELLACYGISVRPALGACDADEAVAAAERLGWPVALKYADRTLRERRDVQGVRLQIGTERELRADVQEMLSGVHDPAVARGFVVQSMARPGVAVIVHAMEDALFGPVVSFGLAGDATELLGDMAHRIPPLTDVDVHDLVRSIRAAPRLFGYRGTPALDVPALEDLLARVSRLADDLPEVAELELFPVLVGQTGVSVLAASARLARPPTRTDHGTRRSMGAT